MSLTAILLLVPASLIHALWNLAGKRQYPSTSLFALSNLAAAMLMLPLPVYYWEKLANIPPAVWQLLAVTGFFQAGYYTSLASAYRKGDMSLAYPLMRSFPAVLIAAVMVIAGRGYQFHGLYFGGVALVILGCFILPMQRFSWLRVASCLDPCCRRAFLGAVFIASYTTTDSEALAFLRATGEFTNAEATLVYAMLEATSIALWLGLFVLASGREERRRLAGILRAGKGTTLFVGISTYLCYGLVLASMAHVENVGYVAAFRQISIPMGVVLGVGLLREPAYLNKLLGTVLISAGLAMVALG